ncbi:MAG: DUF3043 domain-containing protein [Georgenia sp.]
MIGRRRTSTPAEPVVAQEAPAGKGHPTPKRKEAEARNRRPIVVDDRKEAKRIARQKRNEAYERQRMAMQTGDERYLPLRDKGPVRRYARNYVDARWSLAEFFMPLALVIIVVLMFVSANVALANTLMIGMYALLLVAIVESAIASQMLRRKLVKKFGAEAIPRWTAFYAFGRNFYWRRLRQPKPQVKRGEFPA